MMVIGVSSVAPALPVMYREFGVGPEVGGLSVTLFTLPGVLLTPFLGALADRVGRRAVLAPSLAVFGLGGIACGFVHSFQALAWLRLAQGAGAAALGSLSATVIADLFDGPERIQALGLNSAVLAIGTAVFPALGGLLSTWDWRYAFMLHGLAVPLAFVVGLRLKNPEPRVQTSIGRYVRDTFESLREPRSLGLFGLTLAAFFVLYGPFVTFFPVRLAEYDGMPAWQIGAVMSGASFLTALVASRLAALSSRFGRERLLLAGFGFYAAFCLGMPLTWALGLPGASGWSYFGPALLFGAAQALSMPMLTGLLVERAPPERRAAFMSVNGMILRLGQTIGPLITGLAFGLAGISGPFAIGALVALTGWILATRLLPAGAPGPAAEKKAS